MKTVEFTTVAAIRVRVPNAWKPERVRREFADRVLWTKAGSTLSGALPGNDLLLVAVGEIPLEAITLDPAVGAITDLSVPS